MSRAERPRFAERVRITILCCGQPMMLQGHLSLREAGADATRLGYRCDRCFQRASVADDWPPPGADVSAAVDAEP